MLGSDVKSELQALKQSSVGTVSLCKKRLVSVLSMESGGEEESSFNFSLNSTAESVKEESSLPSSLPLLHFFLKDISRITGSRKRRRPDNLDPTLHNISVYLAGLDNIKESKINEDLKLLKLNSAGNLKTKRRRIKSFFKVNGSDGKQDKQQLDMIQHRLDIIENSSVSLSNKLEAMLTKFSQAHTSSASKGESASSEKLSQDLDELNHKINSQMDSLSQMLSRTETITLSLEGSIAGAVKLKDDLSDWSKSVYGSDFSLKIDEIHKEVKKGLNSISDSEPRMSYRRALLSQNSSGASRSQSTYH